MNLEARHLALENMLGGGGRLARNGLGWRLLEIPHFRRVFGRQHPPATTSRFHVRGCFRSSSRARNQRA
jgi:hypothetical protein